MEKPKMMFNGVVLPITSDLFHIVIESYIQESIDDLNDLIEDNTENYDIDWRMVNVLQELKSIILNDEELCKRLYEKFLDETQIS